LSLQLGLFAHPIYSPNGDYPDVVKANVGIISAAEGYLRSRLRNFTPEEIPTIQGRQHSHRPNVKFQSVLKKWLNWSYQLERRPWNTSV